MKKRVLSSVGLAAVLLVFTGTASGNDPFNEFTYQGKLVLNGTMEGLESDVIPFWATLTGEYDEAENLLEADLEGEAMDVEGTGTMTGSVTDTDPMTMAGTWEAEAPDIAGVADGTWTAIME